MKPINVISLFDGMACGRQALKKAKIKVANYYALEIDKYAIQIAKKNHKDITHLGDIRTVTKVFLRGMLQMDGVTDLLIGGSPCQGFSFAGKQKGMSTTMFNTKKYRALGKGYIKKIKIRRFYTKR